MWLYLIRLFKKEEGRGGQENRRVRNQKGQREGGSKEGEDRGTEGQREGGRKAGISLRLVLRWEAGACLDVMSLCSGGSGDLQQL